MKEYTLYKCNRHDLIECDCFINETMILRSYMAKNSESAPVIMEVNGISLESEYDNQQTLIPGVTKRIVKYRESGLKFADLLWNRDESYTMAFGDETVTLVREGGSLSFKKENYTVAVFSRFSGEMKRIYQNNYEYTPMYTVEAAEDISQQALYLILSFPLLYFGY